MTVHSLDDPEPQEPDIGLVLAKRGGHVCIHWGGEGPGLVLGPTLPSAGKGSVRAQPAQRRAGGLIQGVAKVGFQLLAWKIVPQIIIQE